MRKRVAIVGIYHESNTFLKKRTSLNEFKTGHLMYGEKISQEYRNAFHEIGGMLEALSYSGIEAVPLFFAEAIPGGVITAHALDYLYEKMELELKSSGPFDGILVAPHGAAVSEYETDADGWWLEKLRTLLGREIPIIGTLDPHANISRKMINATTALIAYKTNPHIDQRETGKQAGNLMAFCIMGKIKPVQYFLQPEATISIEQQYTEVSPCKEMYDFAYQISNHSKILSVSVILGFPYADVAEMGSGFIVVTDNDIELAKSSAKKLGNYLSEKRSEFIGNKLSVKEAVAGLESLSKPVLLLDMGDNVGGGAPGDSTFILEELEKSGKWKSFICIYDPESVVLADRFDPGDKFCTEIGGKTNHLHGQPYRTAVILKVISEGVFQENQARHGGQVNFNMGRTAIVETSKNTTIMLTSLRIVPFSLNQLVSFGINPLQYDVIVAKGVHAPLAAYNTVCRSFVRVNTEGITHADLTKLPYKNRRKPLYPFEEIE